MARKRRPGSQTVDLDAPIEGNSDDESPEYDRFADTIPAPEQDLDPKIDPSVLAKIFLADRQRWSRLVGDGPWHALLVGKPEDTRYTRNPEVAAMREALDTGVWQ